MIGTRGMVKRNLYSLILALSSRTKALLGLWVIFLLLVVAGIHGSSTAVTADWWAPEKPYNGYLLWAPTGDGVAAKDDSRRDWLMARAQWIRWDELLFGTPLALSQLSHKPKFPVINTNIGVGQNMLISYHTPVWHIATLARPATWGYFLFGAQRGLAWYWWFQVFACFTVLYLLFEILLPGKSGLAAFGAFWYCASAYVVCWSLWPAHITFFIALSCLSAYHLFTAEKRATLVICAILLGLSLSGFVMIMYPPWQVSLGLLFLFLFAGLVIRDRLYDSFKSLYRVRLFALLGAAMLVIVLLGAFLYSCLADLKVMSATVYPGKRVSLGGDYSFPLLFKGMYNLVTIYQHVQSLLNQSEAASFYYLFPAVFLALCLSQRFRKGIGAVGWLLVLYLTGMLVFFLVGAPEVIARLTFLSYVPPYRADAAIGLASIILCLLALTLTDRQAREEANWWERLMPWLSAALVSFLFFWHGRRFIQLTQEQNLTLTMVLIVSLVAGLLSYGLLSGRKVVFCALLGPILIYTTAFFNPLSTNLDHIYKSELAQQILRLNKESGGQPLWLCYGGVHPGILVTALGGRSLSGLHWPPQVSLWRKVDPSGFREQAYNRYAQVQLAYGELHEGVRFNNSQEDALVVTLPPQAPMLKELGARFVLALEDAQKKIETGNLTLVYHSSSGAFSIYEIPE